MITDEVIGPLPVVTGNGGLARGCSQIEDGIGDAEDGIEIESGKSKMKSEGLKVGQILNWRSAFYVADRQFKI